MGCLAFDWKLTLGFPSCGLCSSMAGVVEVKFESAVGVRAEEKVEFVVVGHALKVIAHAR